MPERKSRSVSGSPSSPAAASGTSGGTASWSAAARGAPSAGTIVYQSTYPIAEVTAPDAAASRAPPALRWAAPEVASEKARVMGTASAKFAAVVAIGSATARPRIV